MAKKETITNVPEIIDTVEALTAKMAAMREAQKVFATYTQEQVDEIFKAAAMAANKQRIPLAKMAVAETGMGVVEDKVIKNHYADVYKRQYRRRLQRYETGARSGVQPCYPLFQRDERYPFSRLLLQGRGN